MTTNDNNKIFRKYICEKCDYKCIKLSQWKQHCKTKKHSGIFFKKGQQKTFKCECGKSYVHRASLYNHKNKYGCKGKKQENVILINTDANNETELLKEQVKLQQEQHEKMSSLFMDLIQTNKELQHQICEIAKQPKTINNTFNILNYLNTDCKDAMNLTEFVEQLKITFEDLLVIKDTGFIGGMEQTLIKELKNMEQTLRPIHCTDKKRKSIYVKEENKWDKDNQLEKISDAIIKVNKKQYKTLANWFKHNPKWSADGTTQTKCLQIMNKINGLDDEDGEKNKKKVINRIVENTILDKE